MISTGVDHHKKCVIFGAGMLYDETIESYTWLLNTFLAAHKKQPRFILTDQDASMKQAVSILFTNSIHRLCMWHIMRKLPSKILNDILDNTTLRSSIHKLVWNLFITPQTFEERWHILMDEYHLNNHPLLCEMFAIRHEWVPCYFREIPMCCLMKTTSRCESSNARFKVNSSETNTLIQFLMCFDTSLDAQRHTQ
ncbi:putative MULE transposase domain, FHY3/FAR1 family [Helianthus annuus]|nr:putative MULE transposase domain, FHY3/FAR1 family [Helianthus annuus]